MVIIKSIKKIFEEEESQLDKFIKGLKKEGVKFSSGETFDVLESEMSIFLNAILTPAIKELNDSGLLAKLIFVSSKIEFPISVSDLQTEGGLTDEEIINGLNARFFRTFKATEKSMLDLYNKDIETLVDYLNVMGLEEEEKVGP